MFGLPGCASFVDEREMYLVGIQTVNVIVVVFGEIWCAPESTSSLSTLFSPMLCTSYVLLRLVSVRSSFGRGICPVETYFGIVDSHPIFSQVGCKQPVHLCVFHYELTQVSLGFLFVDIDTEYTVELLCRPDAAQSISIRVGVIPFGRIYFRIHVDDSKQPLHGLLSGSCVSISIFPKVLDLASRL